MMNQQQLYGHDRPSITNYFTKNDNDIHNVGVRLNLDKRFLLLPRKNSFNLLTQAITAAFFAGIGDILAQSMALQQHQIQRRIEIVNDDDDDDDYSDNNDNSNVGMMDESTSVITARTVTKPITYDIHRTMHYIFKGLGGGCMWGTWFSYSDAISLDVTQRLFDSIFYFFLPAPISTEMGYAVFHGDINVATAMSQICSTTIIPFLSISGQMLQHVVHVIICIMLEQFIISPFFYTIWDIPIPALLSGSPIRQIPAQIHAKLIPLLIANAKVWTPANVITYSLPSEYRVLFASMTDVIWQTILSDITSNEIILEPPPPKATTTINASQQQQQQTRESVSHSIIPKIQQDTSSSSVIVVPNTITEQSVVSVLNPTLPKSSSGITTTTTTTTILASSNIQDAS